MKRLSLVLTAVALILPQAGQAGWWRTYGGIKADRGYCIQLTSDENYIISGLSEDYNLWLLKVDTAGKIVWSKTYGRGLGNWVEETLDSGYIVAGANDYDGLLKTDSKGDSIWSKDYSIVTRCVQVTPDGNYVATGSINERLALVKTNTQGDTLWTRFYTEPVNNLNRGHFVQNTNDGGFIITGYTGYVEEGYSWSLLWLLKTDSEGEKQWSKTYGVAEFENFSEGNCVRQTLEGGYVVVGGRGNSLWVLLTDSLGDTIRTRTYSSGSGGLGFNVSLTSDSGYIATGITTSALLASFSPALNDLWLLKFDTDGDTLWTRTYGGDEAEDGYCVLQTPDKGYIVVGGTQSYGAGSADLYLLKTDSLGLLAVSEKPIDESQKNWELLTPIGKEIVFRYWDMPQGFHASIYDAAGRMVGVLDSSNPKGTLTWGSGSLPGVYFIKVTTQDELPIKVVVVH